MVTQQNSSCSEKEKVLMTVETPAFEPRDFKIFEYHEREPHFLRKPFCAKVNDLLRDSSYLESVRLSEDEFNFGASWFSVLWTCQKVCKPKAEEAIKGEVEQGQMSAIQFLILYKFCPDRLIHPQANVRNPVELIGVLPLKADKESFWVSPSHLSTENNLQGQLYD